MALALTAYEASICSGCGLPASVGHGEHNVGRFEVRGEEICHGCAALEEERESSKDKQHLPGEKFYLHDAYSEAPTQ